jgi:hypothetical protein
MRKKAIPKSEDVQKRKKTKKKKKKKRKRKSKNVGQVQTRLEDSTIRVGKIFRNVSKFKIY